MRRLATGLLLSMLAGAGSAGSLDLAWARGGQLETRELTESGQSLEGRFDGERMVPLGSLWKLFVYVYAVENKLPLPDYRCDGRQPEEEVYCCEPGQSVARDAALAKSCGLFFGPERLRLDGRAWSAWWRQQLDRDVNRDRDASRETARGTDRAERMAWLQDLGHMRPQQMVSLNELLAALAVVPPNGRAAAESALLRVVLNGRGADTVRYFGGQLRVKTYSWHQPPIQLNERLTGQLNGPQGNQANIQANIQSAIDTLSQSGSAALAQPLRDEQRLAGAEAWSGDSARMRRGAHRRHGGDPAQAPRQRLGGAAGWLADGTPVWFGGVGTSAAVLQHWAPALALALPAVPPRADAGCVVVDYFQRYPIQRVMSETGSALPGSLNGRYKVTFENGNSVAIESRGEMMLEFDDRHRAHLRGRIGINEYVARVIDREAGTAEPEAAKAFAIAARSYLQQNAVSAQGCQRIADSSATQRVSPRPASLGAKAIAAWTDQLVLAGSPVRYHSSKAGVDTMSWSLAREQAQKRMSFDQILRSAYPRAELNTLAEGGGMACTRLAPAEAWLAHARPHWERRLRKEAGYEAPPAPSVCALAGGSPYSEQSRNRIYVRGLATREDRITLAHEFVHLGLRNHPRGQDEVLVEQIARRLIDAPME